MRKFILLAGSALTVTAAPAFACDLELLGGPQRFNAFASYASHSAPATNLDIQVEANQPSPVEQQPEAVAEIVEPPADQGRDYDNGSPLPSETFR
ncbi:hypothetical protein FPZ54_02695 [Sphingomonas suaedae]|uniref:Uncharacterized protein n=1 Tax=Sphingomonas suaedae TaxID=2599297 RepID=A0A518RC60_9SPHN|nr:hypothetical protein [Sphingomonas suaedae]QDX25038.1 hypothetical protein FPZ54_02695 [Sphingomonas suaedae]